MTFCSGIGAPEMAAPWVDWRLASEVEAFPRAVLQERLGYKPPADHNQGEPLLWGDMTEVTPDLLRDYGIPLPDVLVAGTPCQAFSVAGLRQGVADARGNLTLKFVETCHAIVDARPDGRLVVLWENVPGVLSDSDNAFGHFLGGLVGAMDALRPPGDGSWPGEGMVQGPRARAAWAVLDAQHFGVAQRRRRVFVVVDFGGACDPAAVLLEPESLRGNPPARGEARQGSAPGAATGVALRGREGGGTAELTGDIATALRASQGGGDKPHVMHTAPTIPARSTAGGGLGTNFDCDGGLIPEIVPQAMSSKCSKGSSGPAGDEVANLIPVVTHSLSADGFDASEDGTGRGTPLVPVVAGTMKACSESGGFSNSADHAAAGYMIPVVCGPLSANGGTDRKHGFGMGQQDWENGYAVPVGLTIHGTDKTVSVVSKTDLPGALRAKVPGGQENSSTTAVLHPVAFAQNQRGELRTSEISPQLTCGGGKPGEGYPALMDGWAVRRLTPTECHRLQGFPDDHTAITYRGKPAADGPQYKALGNSMAVPCVAWIMDRIRISAGWV
jgi:DNA (cytosine-5)-methyltransferase 1